MKLFAINETEWVAAESEEDALEYDGLERDEVKSIEEIPESSWDTEIEVYQLYDGDEEDNAIKTTVRKLMEPAIKSGRPTKILTEEN